MKSATLLLSILAASLALSACQTAAQDGGDAGGVTTRKVGTVQQQFEYRTIAKPDRIFDTPLDIAQHFVGNFPAAIEGRPLIEVKVGRESETANRLTLLVTTNGYLDDSVYGEQWRIRISSVAGPENRPEKESWRVASAEHRFSCRGEDGAKWSITPCP